MKLKTSKFLFVLLSVTIFFSSCSNQTLTGFVPLSFDKTLGLEASKTISYQFRGAKSLDKKKYKTAYTRLNHILTEILESGKVKHSNAFTWELTIMHDEKTLNAFCLPGGKIYVFTGLIKYLDSEDALAGVLAHEIAHADCRHGTAQIIKNAGLSLLITFIFGVDDGGLVNLGANLLSLGFSRADEAEADKKSVEYLYPTTYDARGAARFFEKLKTDNKDPEVLAFLSTHPDTEERINEIIKHWEKLGSKQGKTFTDEYKKLKKALP
ncbi:MAG: M48 family metallopeptidase [Bacteroidia bacterium]